VIPYSSFAYLGVLLYFIVPLVLCGVIFPKTRAKNWIVLGTLFMLLIQYWDTKEGSGPQHLSEFWVVLGFALLQWLIARIFIKVSELGYSTLCFWTAILSSLSVLLLSKFSPFSHSIFFQLLNFVGISYATFRSLDVLIAIRDKTITKLPLVQYFAYLLFFPSISSGPIDRYRRFSTDWERSRSRTDFLSDLDASIELLFRGLLYKFLLASLIQHYWIRHIAHSRSFLSNLNYMYGYSFYLFFDFAGYSAFAVCFSYLLGVRTPQNFNLPFLSSNIKEFWDRWHISLSWWFRDHVYNRFVMAALKAKWFKNRLVASYLGFFLTMGLMGLWHGEKLHYIVYGIYHALLLCGHDLFVRTAGKRAFFRSRLWQKVSIFITFNAVCFGLLIFSGRLF